MRLALAAWRSARAGRHHEAHRRAAPVPALEAALRQMQAGDPALLSAMLQEMADAAAEGQMRRAAGATEQNEEDDRRLERERARSALWAQKGTRRVLAKVTTEDGEVEGARAVERLTQFWSRVFADYETDPNSEAAWLAHAPSRPAAASDLPREDLAWAPARPRKSSLGPDGVPYAAWPRLGALAEDLLWAETQRLAAGGEPADSLNESYMAVIPKGALHTSDDHHVARAPGDTRPIQLSNIDAKFMAICLEGALSRWKSEYIDEEQFGFVGGRLIHDNIMAVLAAGEIYADMLAPAPMMILLD